MADRYAFEFEGREYHLDRLMLSEARMLQQVTGLRMAAFDAAASEGDVECLAALLWIVRRRDQPDLQFTDVDGDLFSFRPLPITDNALAGPLDADNADDDDAGRAEGNGRSPSSSPPPPQPTTAVGT